MFMLTYVDDIILTGSLNTPLQDYSEYDLYIFIVFWNAPICRFDIRIKLENKIKKLLKIPDFDSDQLDFSTSVLILILLFCSFYEKGTKIN